MRCEQCRGRFSEIVDRVLTPAEAAAAVEHLESCAECRAELVAYRRMLDDLGGTLRRMADGEVPKRPFPQRISRGGRYDRGWRWAGLAAAALVGLVLGRNLSRVERAPEVTGNGSETRLHAKGVGHEESRCSWAESSLADLAVRVPYPVVADECLENDFELVATLIGRNAPCAERVRLTYRSGGRRLTIEQQPEGATPCPGGEHVSLGDHLGCLEDGGDVSSIRWNQHQIGFHLRGDVRPSQAVRLAQAISTRFTATY